MSAQVDEGDEAAVASGLAATIRTCLAVIVPVAVTLVAAAGPLVGAVFEVGAARGGTDAVARTVVCFVPGLVAFTVHYLVLRGFYAHSDTRTPFFVQVGLVAVNVGLALALASAVDPSEAAYALALAWSGAYLLGAVASLAVLRRRHLPLLRLAGTGLAVRLGVALVPTALAAWGVREGGYAVLADLELANLGELLLAVLVVAVGIAVFLLAAVLLRIPEVTDVVDLVLARVRPGRRGAGSPRLRRPAGRHARRPRPTDDAQVDDRPSMTGTPAAGPGRDPSAATTSSSQSASAREELR